MKVITIGRFKSNEFVVNDPKVSRHHLQIIQDDMGNFRLADFGSTNGTFVNGHKVSGEIEINLTDIIRIGNTPLAWQKYFEENRHSSMPENIEAYTNQVEKINYNNNKVVVINNSTPTDINNSISGSLNNEKAFLKNVKNYLQSDGFTISKAKIKTGTALTETLHRDYENDSLGQVIMGTSDNMSYSSSDMYTYYENPFDIKIEHNQNRNYGHYTVRLQVDTVKDHFVQINNANMHVYDYLINGKIRWVANDSWWVIFIGAVLGIILVIAIGEIIVFAGVLAASFAVFFASKSYKQKKGNEKFSEINNQINYTISKYEE